MPLTENTTVPPRLRLIDGGERAPRFALGGGLTVQVEPQAQLLRRPGDHLELVTFSEGPSPALVRSAAKRRGLCGETALALVVERALVIKDLRCIGFQDLIVNLNRKADVARPAIEMWSAHASYVRHLLGFAEGNRHERPLSSPRVALPVRLIDRFNASAPQLGEEVEVELGLAVDWEIAALVAGQTMGEWAYRAALVEVVD
jgi:hypothetical protein